MALLYGCLQTQGNKDTNTITENMTTKGNTITTTDTSTQNNAIGGDSNMNLVVQKGDNIKVDYVGKFPDTGEIFDKSEGRGPLEFTAGAGQMIKGFDAAVIGMKLNEEKTVTIAPKDAYGDANSGQEVEVPLANITGDNNTELTVGTTLYTQSGQKAIVTDVNNGVAKVKIQHPLAGKTLQFWIKVVEIKK